MKISKVMSYLLSTVVLISIAIGVNSCMSEQDEILEYLEEKYGEKFEVERYWTENNGSSYLSHKMIVYPVDYPELFFKAGKYRDPIKQQDILWDSYIKAKWSMDYSKKHKAKLLTISEREMDVKLFVNVVGDPPVKYLKLSMDDYLATQKGEESKPSGLIEIVVKADKEPNKNEEVKWLYRMYKQIESMNLHVFTLDVWYVKDTSYDHARKISQFMQVDENASIEAIGKGNWYYRVNVWDSDKVNSSHDLLKFFKKEE